MSRELGQIGEKLAIKKLKDMGYKIITVNYRCPFGEIDIIAEDEKAIVFIEVRTKSKINYGYPQETVNREKQKRIRKVAQQFLMSKKYGQVPCRFDVVGVILPEGQNPVFEIIKDAF